MDTIEKRLRQRLGERLKISESLKPYTTMKVGGPADYFFVASVLSDLVAAVTAAWELNLPYFVLGGGSNVLVSDYGFPGLVIKNETKNLVFLKEKSQVVADSGTPLGYFISQCASQGLAGFEWASGIPGTIGGALYGNMAAWGEGKATINFVKAVTMLMPPGWEVEDVYLIKETDRARYRHKPSPASTQPIMVTVKPDWFSASYRTTRLKEMVARGEKKIPVILTVSFQLFSQRQDEITAKLRHYQQLRKERQPIGQQTMGSTFRNPGGFPTPEEMTENLRAAGWYIDQSGLKGKELGGVVISTKHANFIVNQGKATARNVRQLIELVQDTVREKFKIELAEEIEYIGRW